MLYPRELENGSVVDRAFVLMKDPLEIKNSIQVHLLRILK